MSDSKFRRLRVLHLVGGDNQTAPNALLLPLLTRGNRQRVESHVVNFVRGSAQFAVVRQSGVPVHELPISDNQFSPGALLELKGLIKKAQPDVIHAWGSSAHFAAMALSSGKKSPPVVWSIARTNPLPPKAGMIEKFVFARNQKYASATARIVYGSAAAAAQHRRAGLPEDIGTIISPGVDADRFRPDPAARQRVRQQLELPPDAVVVGMYAPFQPEFDHATLLKAVGELTRTNQHLYCVLAGRGMVRGNAALMAMVGGGTLGTRTRVIGEWSDIGALFNACDVVCSSATTDVARLALAMSMLCGVMCVATGMGAQGEVIGSFGVAVEPGSPDAMAKGIRRILEMPADRHAFMSREARKHAWQNFNITRSIDRYHELYIELATGEAVKLTADKPDPVPDAPIIARPTPAVVAAKPVEEAPVIPQPAVVVQEPIAPTKPDTLTADLDAMLAKQGDALAKGPDSTIKHSPQDDVMDWSEDDAKLIEGVMVEADTTMMKALDVRSMPVAKPSESKAAAEAKLAATKSAEQKASEQKLLAARRAELQRAESNMMRAATPVKPKPVSSAPPATLRVEPKPETRPEAKPIELKLVETKPVESKSAEIKTAEKKLADVKPIDTKAECLSLESEPHEARSAQVKAAEAKPAEAKVQPKPIEPTLELVPELKIESASAEVRPVDAKIPAPATPAPPTPEPRTLELELVVPDEPVAAVQLNSATRS